MIQQARGLTPGRAGPETENPRRTVLARIDRGYLRSAFTMVELLVVMVVIGILAGIALGALSAARESARVAKTKTTIAKLDSIVMEKYESYLTRRVPINTTGSTPYVAAQQRLKALRDLMRMEMPERGTDLVNGPKSLLSSRPAMQLACRNKLTALGINLLHVTSAECLYMIVTIGNPEARAQFSDSEVGDTNANGLPEFLDAWGNPIMFLRWAPGFVDSDIQSNDPGNASDPASFTDHDPFDPMRVDIPASESDAPRGWRLVPLIYSAGPDGISGIDVDSSYEFYNSPYYRDIEEYPNNPNIAGSPDSSEGAHRFDNIHNHRLEVK